MGEDFTLKEIAVALISRAWRILMYVKDGLALLFLMLFFGALYAVLDGSPNPSVGRGGALLLDMDGVLVEQEEDADPRALLTGELPVTGQIRVRDIVRALELAAKDDRIKAVALDLSGFWGGGQANLAEVSAALQKVRAAKKPILAYAGAYADDSYQLAAHANEVWVDPMGGALFAGPGGSRPYYKGLADRLGVTVHVYRAGTYKSFVEPYIRADQSPEAREAEQALVGALWQNWQDEVQRARPKAKLAAFIADPAGTVDRNAGSLAKAALAEGIVDQIADKTRFAQRVAKLVGGDEEKGPGFFNHVTFSDYLAANPQSSSGDAVGIVTVAGAIVDGHAGSGTAGGLTLSELIDTAIAEKTVKALVVRVDSGGGSAFASEQIRLALERAKAKGIPVVTSMGSAAASGGYWVALAGDKIFAHPETITGSIGVFGVFPTLEKALPKWGITADGVRTTPLSGQPDPLRGTSPEVDRVLQAGTNDIYRQFLGLVSTRRKLPLARADAIGQGRVWDGGTARQIGLVDAFGSLDDAVAEAARRAKLDPAKVRRVDLEPEQSFLSSLLGDFVSIQATEEQGDVFSRFIRRQQSLTAGAILELQDMLKGPAIQARCLECPVRLPRSQSAGMFKLLTDKVF